MGCKVAGIAFLGLALATATAVLAQQGNGDTELQIQGSLSLDTSSSKDSSGTVNGLAGRFFTDRQELGPLLTATIRQENKISGLAGGFYRYNFSTGQMVPYLGGSAQGAFGSSGSGISGLILTLEGGFRYFLDRRTAFSVGVMKEYSSRSEVNKILDKQIQVLFGFSHLWGK